MNTKEMYENMCKSIAMSMVKDFYDLLKEAHDRGHDEGYEKGRKDTVKAIHNDLKKREKEDFKLNEKYGKDEPVICTQAIIKRFEKKWNIKGDSK